MSKRLPFGPQLPATPGERDVYRDYLLERGFGVPWTIEHRKPTKMRGSAIAAKVSALMAKLAEAESVLANIDEHRAKAEADVEADVEAAEKALDSIGIDSMRDLRGLNSARDYAVCAHPDCQRIDTYHYGDPREGWVCEEHGGTPF